MDQLKNALAGALGVPAPPAAVADPALPDALSSAWGEILRRSGISIPVGATLGQLRARSDQLLKSLKGERRNREAEALDRARSGYEKELAKAAWGEIKAKFTEMELPERAYRAIKQEDADPLAVLLKLKAKRAQELRGAGADRVRDALLGK